MLNLVLNAVAVWRVSRMLVSERGPFNIFVKIREHTGIEHDDGEPISWPSDNVLSCMWCTSVWVSFIMILMPSWVRKGFGIAGMAMLVEVLHSYGESINYHNASS